MEGFIGKIFEGVCWFPVEVRLQMFFYMCDSDVQEVDSVS